MISNVIPITKNEIEAFEWHNNIELVCITKVIKWYQESVGEEKFW
jgi:hypothetical protein